MLLKQLKLGIITSVFYLLSSQTIASTYTVPPENESLIGRIQFGKIYSGDDIAKLSLRYDIGYNALEKTNPQLNLAKPLSSGAAIKIPTQHLLPNLPRVGIIVNLPEMRMYYFVPGTSTVVTYPIGIGKIGKTIPLSSATITKKIENPTWIPPEDIREFILNTQGIALPQVMPAGPDNPLGPYAIYMTIPTFLIHSTIFPESVGKRASFGCVRMFESDIKEFFPSVTTGLPIVIINSPIKVAWQQNHLYMEAYRPLEENSQDDNASLPGAVTQINELSKGQDMLIDWQAVAFIEVERDGLPHEIGTKIN